MKVKECTLIKPISCTEKLSVVELAKILREHKQRRIIVVDAKQYPVGIISTTDINNRVVAEGKDPTKTTASAIMTSPVAVMCDIEETVSHVFKEMVGKQSYFVPVTKDNKLFGILTYAELGRQVHKLLKPRQHPTQ